MKIVFTGRGGKSGAWKMRAVQMAEAIRRSYADTGATAEAIPFATRDQIRSADVLVVVKRVVPEQVEIARKLGVPIVYDPVDFWPQPSSKLRIQSLEHAKDILGPTIDAVRAGVVIGTHPTMVRDLVVMGYTSALVWHHSDPGIVYDPDVGARIFRNLVYEGHPRYIGHWQDKLDKAARRRRMEFLVNPPPDVPRDVMVSVRAAPYDGFVELRWKSGVKMVNSIAYGAPFIATPHRAYDDLGLEKRFQFDDDESLEGALEAAVVSPGYSEIRDHHIDVIVRDYVKILSGRVVQR